MSMINNFTNRINLCGSFDLRDGYLDLKESELDSYKGRGPAIVYASNDGEIEAIKYLSDIAKDEADDVIEKARIHGLAYFTYIDGSHRLWDISTMNNQGGFSETMVRSRIGRKIT